MQSGYTKNLRAFLRKNSIILSLVFFALFGTGVSLFAAAPDTEPYQPGETLDPTCIPGSSVNCTVRILPSQIGNAGKFLTTNGTTTSWASVLTSPSFSDVTLTGNTTFPSLSTAGGILYTDGSGVLTQSATGIAGQAIISGGATGPTYFAPTLGSILFAGTSGILSENNSNFFWDNTNNRLGLGTSTPSVNLEVKSPISNDSVIAINTTSVDFDSYLSLQEAGVEKWKFRNQGDSGDRLRIGSATNPLAISVSQAGQVSLGSTTASAWLYLPASTGAGQTAPLKFTAGTNIVSPETGAVEYNGTQLFFTPASTRNILAQVLGSTALTSGSIPFASTSGYLAQDNSNFFWDDTNNRLGIGTATPAVALDVNGVVKASFLRADYLNTTNNGATIIGNFTSENRIYDQAGTWLMTLKSGNVGIGASSPAAGLHVSKITEQLRLGYDASNYTSFTTSSGGGLTIAPSGGSLALTAASGISATGALNVTGDIITAGGYVFRSLGAAYLDSASSQSIFLRPGGSTAVTVLSGGNVGIGTTTPGSQLQVNASSAATIGSIFRGAASQTANLTEWQDSGATPLASINSLGYLSLTPATATATGNALSIAQTWNNAGAAFKGIDVNIINNASGVSSRVFDLRVGGTSQFSVNTAGLVSLANDLNLNNTVIYWTSGSQIRNSSDGVLLIRNSAGNGFTRLQFGNTTNSFNAIARDAVNGFSIQAADGTATYNDASTVAAGTVANRYIFGIAAPTLTSTNAVTNTVASTFFIGGAPTASTNTTIGTALALNVAGGNSYFGGNVGIGTTSPTAKLEVSALAQAQIARFNGGGAAPLDIVQADSGATGIGPRSYVIGSNFTLNSSNVPIVTGQLNYLNGYAISFGQNSWSTDSGLAFWSGTGTGGAMTEKMRISNSGNVGIGRSDPFYTLDVRGNATSGVSVSAQFLGGTLGSGGGLRLGAWSAAYGGFWSANVLPSSTNYALISNGSDTAINTTSAGGLWVNNTTNALYWTSSGVSLGGTTNIGQLGVLNQNAGRIGLVVRGFTSQTVDLQQWQDSGSTVLASINSAGTLSSNGVISSYFSFGANGRYYAQSNGEFVITNSGATDFTRLNFGGTSNSYNSIARDVVNGFSIQSAAGTNTYNDRITAASGTVANRYIFGIAAPTLTSTNAVTNTIASTLFIGGAPIASTNTTIGTALALNVAGGNSYFGGNVGIGSTSPSEKLVVDTGNILLTTSYGVNWAGGSRLYEQGFRMLYQPNGDRFEVMNEAGSNFIAGFHGPLSGLPSSVRLYYGTAIGSTYAASGTVPSNGLIVEGNVGIGTTSPTGRLDVSAGLGSQTAGDLVVDTANNIVYVGKLDSVSGNTNFIFRDRLGGVKSRWENAGSGSIGFSNFSNGFGVSIGPTISGSIGSIGTMLLVQNANAGSTNPTAIFKQGTTQTGNLLEWQSSAGTIIGRIEASGNLNMVSGNLTVGNGNASIVGTLTQSGGYSSPATIHSIGTTNSTASGSYIGQRIGMTFNPASGGATMRGIEIAPTINQTGGANGSTFGILINPSITVAADWRSLQINTGSTTGRGIIIQGVVSQSADLTQWQDSSSTVLANVSSAGQFQGINGSASAPTYSFNGFSNNGMFKPSGDTVAFSTASSERMRITSTGQVSIGVNAGIAQLGVVNSNAGGVAMVVRGAGSQSANLVQFQDALGVVLSRVAADGSLFVKEDYASGAAVLMTFAGNRATYGIDSNADFYIDTSSTRGTAIKSGGVTTLYTSSNSTGNNITIGSNTSIAKFGVINSNASTVASVIRGTTSQSADLTQWQDNSATVLGAIKSSGAMVIGNSGAQIGSVPLSVVGSGTDAYIAMKPVGQSGFGFTFGTPSAQNSELWNYGTGFMRFATNNAEYMRIVSTGDVGVGTSTPLTVNGISVAGERVLNVNGSGGTRLAVQSASGSSLDFVNTGNSTNAKWALFQNLSNNFIIKSHTDAGSTRFTFLTADLTTGNLTVGNSGMAKTLTLQSDRAQILVKGSTDGGTGPFIDYDINSSSTAGTTFARISNGTLSGATSGTNIAVAMSPTFNPATGSGIFRTLDINYTTNASGAQGGSITGIRVNRNLQGGSTAFTTDMLADFQAGGISQFSVRADGVVTIGSSGYLVTPTIFSGGVGTTAFGNRVLVGTTGTTTAQLETRAASATTVPLFVRGASLQTADLQQWQGSDSTRLLSVNSAGNIVMQAASDKYIYGGPASGNYINMYNSLTGRIHLKGLGTAGAQIEGALVVEGALSFNGNLSLASNSILGTSNSEIRLYDGSTGNIQLRAGTGSVGISQISFWTGTTPTERMKIDSSGNVGIGVTNPGYRLEVGNNTVSGIVSRFVNSTGTCDINPTTTSLSCSSDQTLKKNITSLSDEFLTKVTSLRPVTYNWNTEIDGTTGHVGFIAQEVEQIFPDLVATDSATGLKSVNYIGFIPYITKAVIEQNIKIGLLEDRVTNLENIINGTPGLIGGVISNVTNLVVDTLKVGTPEKRTGITIYDEATGDPFCVKVVNGSMQTVPGECGVVSAPTVNQAPIEAPVVSPEPEVTPSQQEEIPVVENNSNSSNEVIDETTQ